MGYIRRPSDSGRGGTKYVDLIPCVDGQEPQIHKMWCLGSNGVTHKIHPTERVEVGARTMGQFTTNYLAENGRRIHIIGKISINGSVKLWGIPNFVRNSRFSFIENLQSPTVPSGWGGANTSNQNWVDSS